MPELLSYPPHIAEALRSKGLTIAGVAQKVGICPFTLRRILMGRRSQMRAFRDTAETRIARILGIPVAQLRDTAKRESP